MPTFPAPNPFPPLILGIACGLAPACRAGPPAPCYSANFSDQLRASDAASNDQLAQSLAATDDILVVGAPLDDNARGSNAGAVYVWTRLGDSWLFQQKLLADQGAAGDRFGQSVAVLGSTLLVGAPFGDADAADTGAAYVFTRSGGAWTQQARLVPADRGASDRFGSAVALAADGVAAIGAPFEETPPGQSDRGAVYMFTRAGAAWTEQQKLTASDAANADQFGSVVAARAGVLAVAAPLRDVGPAGDAGQVYTFESADGVWSQRQILAASKAEPLAAFGSALALGDGLMLVGARRDFVGDARTGAAYVYTRAGDTWIERQKLSGGGQFDDFFGSSVAVAGRALLVGASNADPPFFPNSGLGYLFTPGGDDHWALELTFAPLEPSLGMGTGASAAAGGTFAFWGAPLDNIGGAVDAGSVLVFDYVTTAPAIIDQPDDVRTCRVANVSFSIQFQDDGSPQFLWRRNGVPLDDGPTPGGSAISGVHTPTLNISFAGPADAALYDVVVTNACGPTVSAAAALVVCPADWSCDGVTTSTDVSEFIDDWFQDLLDGNLRTDIDGNGVVNSTDVSEFINRWFDDLAGGC